MSPLAAVRTPGVLRTLALSLVARVPGSALALLLVLQARHLGHSYAIGGVTTGASAVGMAVGAPLLGRSADHRGPSLVLRVSSALAAASLVAIAALPRGSTALALVGLAALAGITQPPVAAAVRAIWVRMLPERVFNATLSVEASLQELAFILGPLVLGSAAADAGPAAALALAAVVLFAATAAFALDREARANAGRAPAAAGAGAGPLVDAGVRLLVGLAVTLGVAFG